MGRYQPQFTLTPAVVGWLLRIEAARAAVEHLPITPKVLATLRQTARLHSTHYSTLIEGNRLTRAQVSEVVEQRRHIPGRQRDEREVLGCFAALEKAEQLAAHAMPVSQAQIQLLHGLAMAGGSGKARPTPYRDGQNVIRDSRTREIVYLPPEAGDVPGLMKELVAWLAAAEIQGLPCPVRAAIAHYQFATIHPYYDGNGRTARLLTTLILHLGGYGLKGIYSLEEYYARDLDAYYAALTVGPSHNYYVGRAEADITGWIEYFCRGAADSFESIQRRAKEAQAAGARDFSPLLRTLDLQQRRAMELFHEHAFIASRDVEKLFGISQRYARKILAAWVEKGFVRIGNASKKSRNYALAEKYHAMLD